MQSQYNKKNICGTLYLQVGELTRLTTGSIRMKWVLGGPSQKLIRIKICKKNFNPIQPKPMVD